MDKLSERLETAAAVRLKCVGAEDSPLYQLLTEAAKLARRVEEAPVRGVLRDNANYLYVGAGTAGLTEGQRVRLVREE